MKLADAKCKIVGIQLGEAELNLIRPEKVPIKAKFALLREDGSTCGYLERANGWSPRTAELLQQLAEAMESDVLEYIFEVQSPSLPADKPDEPPQF